MHPGAVTFKVPGNSDLACGGSRSTAEHLPRGNPNPNPILTTPINGVSIQRAPHKF